MLDPRTLAVAAGFATAIQAIAILYIWFVQLRQRAVLEFSIAAFLVSIGAFIAIMRPHWPLALTHVAATCILLCGHALAAHAFALFLGRRLPIALLVGVTLVCSAAIAFFLVATPFNHIRIAAYSLGVAFNALIIAAMLLDMPKGPLRVTHWPVGALHLIHGTFALIRAFAVLIEPPRTDVFEPSTIQAIWFLQSLVVVNLTFVGLVLMVTQRTSMDLDRQASEDGLTGALNRRAFESMAAAEWSRSNRHDLPLSVLVLDLDHFKKLNDTYGHDIGDAWLSAFSRMTHALLRREDILCRYGGEEFVVLLPQTSLDAAHQAAQRIRRATEGLMVEKGPSGTVSIGVAEKTTSHADFKAMLSAADQALYRAKAAGRNRVEIAR